MPTFYESAPGIYVSASVTPTVTAAAYSAGNVVGPLLIFSGIVRNTSTGGLIQFATAAFASGVVPTMDVVFFNASPSNSTFTDKAALAVNALDLSKVIGVAHLNDPTLLGASSPSFVQGTNLPIAFGSLGSTGTLYAVAVMRSAVTLGSTSDMILSVQVVQ
jgi:hypothetical protein